MKDQYRFRYERGPEAFEVELSVPSGQDVNGEMLAGALRLVMAAAGGELVEDLSDGVRVDAERVPDDVGEREHGGTDDPSRDTRSSDPGN